MYSNKGKVKTRTFPLPTFSPASYASAILGKPCAESVGVRMVQMQKGDQTKQLLSRLCSEFDHMQWDRHDCSCATFPDAQHIETQKHRMFRLHKAKEQQRKATRQA
jgi:hypothetical protein